MTAREMPQGSFCPTIYPATQKVVQTIRSLFITRAKKKEMPSSTVEDPRNLSSLYFTESRPTRKFSPFVAKDAFQIVRIDEIRGRGLIATQALSAGTCLFVIPPTVSAPFLKVLKEWKARGGRIDDPSMLEEAAEEVLFQEMRRTMEDESTVLLANSFLVLEGSSGTTLEIPSMDCLLGLGDSKVLIRSNDDVSDEELRQIIRRNAFGPDFVSYRSILANLPKRPHRVLGLYPLADMANHSCQPNTVRVYVGDLMVIHTNRDIAPGEEITTSYVPPTFCYPHRQESMMRSHGFTCSSQRSQLEADFWNNTADEQMKKIAELQEHLSTADNVLDTVQQLEDTILPLIKPSELQRYLRLGFVPLYTSYFNQALTSQRVSHEELLRLCMQLHFSFVTGNPSSTEHLSILHLGYELISNIHGRPGNDTSKSLPKLNFWTEQLKAACMTRYGSMGNDVDAVRKVMQHTRLVLRTQDGMQRASYPFI